MRLFVGLLIGLLIAGANVAGSADWTIARLVDKNKAQDYTIWQTRTVVRQQFDAEADNSYRLDLLLCEPQPECRNGVELAWQMLGPGWTGWPQK